MTIAPTDADVVLDRRGVRPAARDDSVAPITTPTRLISGTAAALYLGLWNRGDDIAENGTVDALGHWRQQVRVSW